ncbi:uncharacterized protein LOC111320469 [Stylophora pistillata]|uniref:uncharacterized protein LOC111320469 n=1 Tax=Stylophora pistillata TaxID=50429 RepID=UPI000C0547DB|nr:uncharacterized protein LOC111320469 [Stylophora pistillata]
MKPAGILVEILNEDGTMARLPELKKVADKFDLKLISIEDLVAYRMQHDSLIQKVVDKNWDTKYGAFRLRAYRQTTSDQIHIALTKGQWEKDFPVPTAVISNDFGNDILSFLSTEKKHKIDKIFSILEQNDFGAVVLINQENHLFNLLQKLKEVPENEQQTTTMDERDFGIGAQILHDLDIAKLQLITNSKQVKRVGMIGYGLEITGQINY